MRKIIGVTVGTPLSANTIKEKLKPVLSVNGVRPDESGNVENTFDFEELTEEQKASIKGEKGDAFTYEDFTEEQLASLKGENGKDGYTPVKGKDYFDGNDGKDGHTPVKGVDYFDGVDGKTAYQYAQEGGFSGSESEFAAKIAKEIPTKVSQLANDEGYLKSYTESDPTVPEWAKQQTKPKYTADEVGARPSTWMPTYSDVGADKSGTADTKVATHNTNGDAHNDIRLLIEGLTTRLNALANSDDTTLDQMKEVVDYIKANRDLIEEITTNKISYSDIVNNLTTNVSGKPLSAAQGVALKALIDAITIPTKVSELTNDAGYLKSYTESDPTVPSWAKASTKPKYTAEEVGAVSSNALADAINVALATAKESGEFDGKDGEDGEDGYTPAKGTDYFTTTDKAEMISELTNKLSLGIASDGLIYLFVNGQPVGTGVPMGQIADIYGYVDENNHIVLEGVKEGSYTFAFVKEDGSTIHGGAFEYDDAVYYPVTSNLTNCNISNSTKTVAEGSSYSATITANSGYTLKSVSVTMGGNAVSVSNGVINIASVTGDIVITAVAEEATVEIVNQIPLSTDTDGTIYNGIGYKTNTRIKGTGATDAYTGASCTGFIKVSVGDVIYIKGIQSNTSGLSKVHCYNSSKATIGTTNDVMIGFSNLTNEGNGVYSCTITNENTAYIRVASAHIMDGSEIVTINQPIV